MAASVLAISFFLIGTSAFGQEAYRPPVYLPPYQAQPLPADTVGTPNGGGLHFTKPPSATDFATNDSLQYNQQRGLVSPVNEDSLRLSKEPGPAYQAVPENFHFTRVPGTNASESLQFNKQPAQALPVGNQPLQFSKEPGQPLPVTNQPLQFATPVSPMRTEPVRIITETTPAAPVQSELPYMWQKPTPIIPTPEPKRSLQEKASIPAPSPNPLPPTATHGEPLHFSKEPTPPALSPASVPAGAGKAAVPPPASNMEPARSKVTAPVPNIVSQPPHVIHEMSATPSVGNAPLRINKEPVPMPSSIGRESIIIVTEPTPKAPVRVTPSTPPTPASGIQRAFLQADKKPDEKGLDAEGQDYLIQLEPPGPKKLFGQLDSEASLRERMRQEALQRPSPDRIEFPSYKPLSDEPFISRQWPARAMLVEPSYLCYDRLLFEQINVERYGWDLRFVAPFVSAAQFYKDVALLPYHMLTDPCRCYECDAGYCLPGDPLPYLCYPPQYSLTGAAAEIGVILSIIAIF
jgi:hypothetical protein